MSNCPMIKIFVDYFQFINTQIISFQEPNNNYQIQYQQGMCYLPLKCLKAIIFIGALCSIAISIGLLALTIYVQVEKKQIISAANQGAVTGSLIALYLSAILFLLLGVAGLSGSMKGMSKKENKGGCLIGLFSIGVMIFFVVFLAGTIFFFVGPETIFGTDCKTGSKTTLINELYAASDEAYKNFCTNDCPCYIKDKNSPLYALVNNNNRTDGKIPNITTTAATGKIKYGDCNGIKSSSTTIEILAAIEDLLGCGGWCSKNQDASPYVGGAYIYRFRNINDCSDPTCLTNLENCHDKFYDFMTGSGRTVGFGCLFAMLVCFINIIAVFCICCHPSKMTKGSNFYSRMIEMD